MGSNMKCSFKKHMQLSCLSWKITVYKCQSQNAKSAQKDIMIFTVESTKLVGQVFVSSPLNVYAVSVNVSSNTS